MMDIVIVINVADFWSLMKRQDGVNSVVTMSLKKLKKRRGIDVQLVRTAVYVFL